MGFDRKTEPFLTKKSMAFRCLRIQITRISIALQTKGGSMQQRVRFTAGVAALAATVSLLYLMHFGCGPCLAFVGPGLHQVRRELPRRPAVAASPVVVTC
jgi:hypothetical protein